MTKIQINRIKQQGMNFGESHQQGHYIAYPIGNSMIRKKNIYRPYHATGNELRGQPPARTLYCNMLKMAIFACHFS